MMPSACRAQGADHAHGCLTQGDLRNFDDVDKALATDKCAYMRFCNTRFGSADLLPLPPVSRSAAAAAGLMP